MIKRVTSVNDLRIIYNSFDDDTIKSAQVPLHYGGEKFDVDLLWKAWSNAALLLNETVIVAHFDKPDHVDGFIFFVIGQDFRVGKKIAQSYMWLSLSPYIGMKLYFEAEKIIKLRSDVDYITMGVLVSSPIADKYEKLLQKRLGYKPEGKSFYKKVNYKSDSYQ